MITYKTTFTLPRVAMALAALGVAGAGAYFFWAGSGAAEPGVVLSGGAQSLPGWPQASTGVADAGVTLAPQLTDDGRPSDVTKDDWEVLKAVMAKQPNGQGQAEAIVSVLRYQRAFDTWQGLDQSNKDKLAQRHNLAKTLLNELPQRLSNGEFTLVESALMAAVLIADIEPDEASRTKALSEWQNKLTTIEPPTEDQAAMLARSRPTQLKRMQANAFLEWQAQTNPAERTQAKLEQAMQNVLRSFNSGG